MEYGIALDLGTSGFRCQAIDLATKETIATAITTRHPIPGMNVIDHVNFAVDSGRHVANGLMVGTVTKLFEELSIDLDKVVRVAVCGNPFQLSIFQNIEIRDLAYAGKSILKRLGVVPPKRDGEILRASDVGLNVPNAELIIPPAVAHEIGADAIAMMSETGAMYEKGVRVVVDYGTNAEMALMVDDQIYTASAAAGPALEGQQIRDGMLAAPGAISDIVINDEGWTNWVLDDSMLPIEGDTVDPTTGRVIKKGAIRAKGVTGTGVIAAIACGTETGLIDGAKIKTDSKLLRLQGGVELTTQDIREAGKAIGAIRSGYLTLMREAGIWVEDVTKAYMSGATGLYVDAKKAQMTGLVTPGAKEIIQFGNTSIRLARKMVTGEMTLDELKEISRNLRSKHVMLATSEVFKDIYSIEISIWMYDMPMAAFNDMMDVYNLPHLPKPVDSHNTKTSLRDLPDVEKGGIVIVQDIGAKITGHVEGCISCGTCEEECPEEALTEKDGVITIKTDRCMGTGCNRCETACPEKVLKIGKLELKL